MRKFCVFTPTYSNNRMKLLDYRANDMVDINFRNHFDLNLYSFHNSPADYSEEYKNHKFFKNIKNKEFVSYDEIGYTQIIKDVLPKLLSKGFTHLIYIQDDCFTRSNYMELSHLINFIKNGDYRMLNLENSAPDVGVNENSLIKYRNGDFTVHDTNSVNFLLRYEWAMDDGAYVSDIEFILESVYDEKYMEIGDIHEAEGYLNKKISKSPIERLTTSYKPYRRCNIIGPNAHWHLEKHTQELESLFGKNRN